MSNINWEKIDAVEQLHDLACERARIEGWVDPIEGRNWIHIETGNQLDEAELIKQYIQEIVH